MWAAIGAAAAPILGGIVGNVMGKKDRASAQAAMAAAMAELNAVGMPPDLSKRVIMEQFQQQGIYTPELEQDIELASSKVSMVQEDPALKQAQLAALSSMQDASRTGFDAGTEADIRASRMDIEEGVQGALGQIQQQMAARGQAGGGAELAMKLQAAQEGERRASEESDRMAAMAAQNALQAMARSGQMAGDIRSQDFGVESARAGAEDQFNLQEWGARNARQTRNVGSENEAAMRNLAEKQRIADENTSVENAERQRMNTARRDAWKDKLHLAEAKAGQYGQEQDYYQGESKRKAGMASGIGSGIGTAAGGYADRQNKLEIAKLGKK